MNLKDLYNQTIGGTLYNGLLKGIKTNLTLSGEWASKVNLEQIDNILYLQHGNRNIYEEFGLGIDTLTRIKEWLELHQYRLDNLYESTQFEYNPIENYDRTEVTTNNGTNIQGERTTSTQYGQIQDTMVNGARSESTQYGATSESTQYGEEKTTNVNGARSETTGIGAQSNSIQYGATTDTSSNTDTAFNSSADYNKGTNKSVTGTIQHTDTTNNGARSDSFSTTQYTDTSTQQQHTVTSNGTQHTDNFSTQSVTDTSTRGQHTDTSTTNGVTDTTAETINSRVHGNIGVTTTQQMIESQRKVVEFEFYKIVVDLLNQLLISFNYEV